MNKRMEIHALCRAATNAVLAGALSVATLAGAVAAPQQAYAANVPTTPGASITNGMPVVITELAVKTSNSTINGSAINAGEFIELTNASAQPVHVSDLKVTYNNVDWTPEAFSKAAGHSSDPDVDPAIAPRSSIVLWSNYANVSDEATIPRLTTDRDFNAFWKDKTGRDPQLVTGRTLFTIGKGAGMANTSARTLVLSDTATGSTNTVSYDDSGSSDTTLAYSYDSRGVGTMSKNNAAAPGTVSADQLPEQWPSAAKRTITLKDSSGIPATVEDSRSLTLSVTAVASDSQDSIRTVRLWTSSSPAGRYSDCGYDGKRDATGTIWTFTIPAGAWTGLTSVSYRFVATDDEGVTTPSAQNTITLEKTPQSRYKPASVPLAITELAVDTPNMNGADGYEFIEVYNTTQRRIDFSNDYTFRYSYPDLGDGSDVTWEPVQNDVSIGARQSAVFWIRNGANDALTAADFNRQYGLTGDAALIEGKNLFEIDCAGMANNSARVLKITTATGTLVSSAGYPDKLSSSMTGDSHSAQYSYTAGSTESKLVRTDKSPTPGSVPESDIMAVPYVFATDVKTPAIKDSSPRTFTPDADLSLRFDATSTGGSIHRATVFYRYHGESRFTKVNLPKTAGSDSFSYTLNKIDLIRKQSVDYYIEASDGINPVVRTSTATIFNSVFDESPLRLSPADGSMLSGTTPVRATVDDPDHLDSTTLSVDGSPVHEADLSRSLESEPFIAADVTQTDIFFLNSFTKKLVIPGTPSGNDWKDNVVGTFDDGTYANTRTVSFPVPLENVRSKNGRNTISMYINSGTKSGATDILDAQGTVNTENSDNYLASNIRLVLPDGRRMHVSRAVAGVGPGVSGTVSEKDVTAEVANPKSAIKMGDSSGQYEYIRLEFAIDDSDMLSRQYTWNTRTVDDGRHTLTADGNGHGRTSTVTVDNTKPVITPHVGADSTQGQALRGRISISADAADATSGVQGKVTAALANADGTTAAIALPYAAQSSTLPSGRHTVTFTVADKAGNTAVTSASFLTVSENPRIVKQEDFPEAGHANPRLSITASGQTGDDVTVSFKRGERLTGGDPGLDMSQGTTRVSGLSDGASGIPVTRGDAAAVADGTGTGITTIGKDDGFPFQEFDMKVPSYIAGDAKATSTIHWNGTANPGEYVYAFVKNSSTGAWDRIARVQADPATGKAHIEQNVANTRHLVSRNGETVIRMVVQTEAGFAPETGGTRSQTVTGSASGSSPSAKAPAAEKDSTTPVFDTADNTQPLSQADTPGSDYDFTFAWESDTQYYNANYDNDGYYQHQADIHDWILANRSRMNIQYLFHTGDIVDDADIAGQWTRADAQYAKLDAAGMPYGVLAGNHDVDHKNENYTNFSRHFGANRYEANPWYGGSYDNNRGHYDLISAGGINFIMVYMGWGIGDEQINWMNDVLAQYPDRVAILDFHEYLLASGGLGLQPQEIYKRVVVPNKNVKIVMSGHYHSAQKTVSSIDSDGDGKPDRKVVNMLFDYQGLEEGGMGYIRLMHVNSANGTMEVRTYSPSLKRYGSQGIGSSTFTPSDEEFTIDLTQLGVPAVAAASRAKTLSTDAMSVDLFSDSDIARTHTRLSRDAQGCGDVKNGSQGCGTVQTEWAGAPSAGAGWYAVVSNPYGGTVNSSVMYVNPDGFSGGTTEKTTGNGQGSGEGSAADRSGSDARADETRRAPLASTGAGIAGVALAVLLCLGATAMTVLVRRNLR